MNLQLINQALSQYQSDLLSRESNEWQQPWQALKTFEYHWDIDARDFATMYDDSFAGKLALWEDDDFHPKQSMLHYSQQQPEIVRSMFVDLFYESRDIVGRIHRFIDQCDELRRHYSKGITKRESHYHEDRRMVFIYLAFRFPESYSLYNEGGFRSLMTQVNAKPIGAAVNVERYMKTSRTMKILMNKNEDLASLCMQLLEDSQCFRGESLLYVSNFYAFMERRK